MAETSPAANNKSVAFGGKAEREMSTSWQNQGISHSGKSEGNPPGVTNAAPMKKPSAHIRKTAKKAIKRGMISEKAAKRHLGGV